jgi:hypothetical protein
MRPGWFTGAGVRWGLAAAGLLTLAGLAHGGDPADLRSLIEQQRRQLDEQQRQIEQLSKHLSDVEAKRRQAAQQQPAGDPAPADGGGDADKAKTDDAAVKKVVGDYLKDNPGAGMPSGVQTGFVTGQGFVIRSAPDPNYTNWQGEESKIPFELRIRGRLMIGAYGYKVTDDANHATGQHQQAQDANAHRFPDFLQLEAKRVNLIFEGSAFDPDLHYRLNLIGSTRGFGGFQNNKVVQTAGAFDPNASGISPTGGGVAVDHVVSLFEAYVYYDLHGCCCSKGCGPDCPDGTYQYCPTYTLIAGKLKPFYGLEEYLGNGNQQFVDFSMTDLFFDADDDTRLMAAGFQVKAAEDRFFLQAIATNGSDGSFLPNSQMDELPGFIMGLWYDLGGTWNERRHAWDLFGDCLSDVDSSCHPVARLGGCVNLVPMDRRSLYGDGEQSRFFAMPAGPGGTRLISLLNGDGSTAATSLRGSHAVDTFDAYSWTAFAAAKWHGFSLSNEWWFRDLNGFKAAPNGGDVILYTYTDPKKGTVTALFPDKALFDYGMSLQGGYFLIPKRLEVVARWSWINGDSGDILGDIHQTPTVFNISSGVPGVATSKGGQTRVQVNPGAFSNFHEANEYTVGINYFFRRQLLKWQTDFSVYQGGNPVGPVGASVGTFMPGLDGYGVRTQLQLAF